MVVAILVDSLGFGTGWDRRVLPRRKGLRAPGLHVRAVERAGDERRPGLRGCDEGADFDAGGVEVGAAGAVGGVGPVGCVLRVEAAVVGGVEPAAGT